MAQRLSKEDWLEHGLKCLSKSGPASLKADVLAKALKVSRGSFYWHFKDLLDFHSALLNFWQLQTTSNVIVDIEEKKDPKARLSELMKKAFSADNRLERSIRAWAIQSKSVAETVDTVDQQRIRYIEKLIINTDIATNQIKDRAEFIYSAYLGWIMLNNRAMKPESIAALADLMQR